MTKSILNKLDPGAESRGSTFPRQKFLVDKVHNRINVLIQMIIRVQPGLGTAIYLQIESQLKHAIAAGALKRDDALPPVRKLAAELRINPNTVARAYQNLERDGILRTVPGGGCYVNGQSPGLLKSEKLRRLRPLRHTTCSRSQTASPGAGRVVAIARKLV